MENNLPKYRKQFVLFTKTIYYPLGKKCNHFLTLQMPDELDSSSEDDGGVYIRVGDGRIQNRQARE